MSTIAARVRPARPRAGRRPGIQLPFLAIPLLFFAAFFVVPVVAVGALAISEEGVGGVLRAATDDLFLLAVRRTVQIAVIVTALCWAIGLAYSLALVMSGRVLRTILWAVLIGSLTISLVARTYGWILLLRPGGLVTGLVSAIDPGAERVQILGTTTAVYIGMVHVMLPFMVLPLYGAMRAIDPSHIRAAHSLGSTPGRILRRVVLPQLRTGTIAGVTLVFLMSFGFFVTPALLGGPSDFMVSTLVQLYFARQFDFGAASAVATWVVLGVMLVYLVVDQVFDISKHWGRA
ncbi:MAG: putative spermidine/putrescine transport system permease protein [Solirubrobacteraceae bacterium]|nr:putative spermidine/putrescine transport system permease protein [Solirubrobacteraceae bacterium]